MFGPWNFRLALIGPVLLALTGLVIGSGVIFVAGLVLTALVCVVGWLKRNDR